MFAKLTVRAIARSDKFERTGLDDETQFGCGDYTHTHTHTHTHASDVIMVARCDFDLD